MDESINIPTDCALLALFDAQLAHEQSLDEPDSFEFEFANIPAVQSGDVAIVGLGGDGVYRVRITDGELRRDERDYAAAVVNGLGVRIVSGNLHLSGYGFDDFEGRSVPCPNGVYDLTLYEIAFDLSPRWWRPDGAVPEDAPAGIVAVLRTRTTDFTPPTKELRLDSLLDWSPGERPFVFESTTRVVGAQPGMVLESKVIKGVDGLSLKACGPDNYRATLPSFEGLKWKDRVEFRVISVHHDKMLIHGEFVRKLK